MVFISFQCVCVLFFELLICTRSMNSIRREEDNEVYQFLVCFIFEVYLFINFHCFRVEDE